MPAAPDLSREAITSRLSGYYPESATMLNALLRSVEAYPSRQRIMM